MDVEAPLPLLPSQRIAPSSDFSMRRLTLRFQDPSDERLFVQDSICTHTSRVQLAVCLVAVLLFDFATGDDSFKATIPAVLFCLGRLLPVLLLLVFVHGFLDTHTGAWSTCVGASLFLSSGAVSATAYWCTADTSQPAAVAAMWSCDAMTDGVLPWRAMVVLVLVPVTASVLKASWTVAAVASTAGFAVYGGLVLRGLAGPELASAVATPLLCIAMQCYGVYCGERAARESWCQLACANRKVVAVVGDVVNGTVQQEQSMRLSRLLRRTTLLVYELDAKGVIKYMTPTSAALLGKALV